ncbi:MAG TPA: Stp1/IreP family PP2C-type Ser/Thr phosphatase [Verrucomicrobiae bacterium]|jgi:serine/threonine protein phosphatase PrpC|nr:Stp1/IreP family PP2C-type Ser/Thr phosphatase [Verrucomicrobiae bacterium]
MALAVEVAGKTDVGIVRANNEDNFGYDARYGIFVVCDGMGGQAAGEVASKIGVDSILAYFREAARSGSFPLDGTPLDGVSSLSKALASAVRRANRAVHDAGARQVSRAGMGCTVVAALVRGNSLNIANVGDSRIYLLRGGTIEQLTEDHSLVMEQVRRGYLTLEQAEQSEMQNIILRALGSDDDVQPDIENLITLPGDLLLLTTDGLTRRVRDEDIVKIISTSPSLERACDALIQAAKDSRGDDNITCLLLRVVERPWYKSIWKKLFPGGREWQNSI